VEVGSVDVGGRLTALSQYPGEEEYLVGPYACLEVTGRPRFEVTDKGQVAIVPVRMNANLKSVTVEELEARRKVLHLAMATNMREELFRSLAEAYETLTGGKTLDSALLQPPPAPPPPAQPQQQGAAACEHAAPMATPTTSSPGAVAAMEAAEAVEVEEAEACEAMSAEQGAARVVASIREEFVGLMGRQEATAAADFNDDARYRELVEEMMDAKDLAQEKLKLWVEHCGPEANHRDGRQIAAILRTPFRELADQATRARLATAQWDFPFEAWVERRAEVDLGRWTPSGLAERRDADLLRALMAADDNLRKLRWGGGELELPQGWASKDVRWGKQAVLKGEAELAGFVVACCTGVEKLDLR